MSPSHVTVKSSETRVTRGEEDVFVYSTHPDSHAIIESHYGQWDDVIAEASATSSKETS